MPLGIPMIVGPAVLTTLLTMARTRGYTATLIAFALNLLIVWAALRWAALIGRALGDSGCRAIRKVLNLVLAAIAVTFIRRGVMAAAAGPHATSAAPGIVNGPVVASRAAARNAAGPTP